jgi:hypothetical protein
MAFDSGASNALKYYNGSAWQTVNTSNATGDFMKDGSVAMTGDFNAGAHNLTNIGTNVTGAAALTLASGGTSDLTLTSASGILNSTTPLKIAPSTLPGAPAAGTIAFDSGAANALKYYNGSAWQTVNTSNATGDFMKDGSVAMTGNLKLGTNYISNDGGASEGLAFDTSGNANFTGKVGIGTSSPSSNLSFIGTSDQTIGMERAGASVAGHNLTVQAGGAGTGTDLIGGDLILASGNSTGAGGSGVEIRVTNDSQGNGTTVRTPDKLMARFDGNNRSIALGQGAISNGRYGIMVSLDGASTFTGTQNKAMAIMGGNVGIGTITPSRLLHVNGAARFTPTTAPSSPAAGDLFFDSTASNALKYYNGSAWQAVGTGSGDFLKDGSVAMTGNIQLNGHYLSGDGDNEGVYVDSSGKVGIGTATPMALLHLVGADNTIDGTMVGIENSSTATHSISGFAARAGNGAVQTDLLADGLGTTPLGVVGGGVGTLTNHPFTLFTNSSPRLTVSAAGKVGIGMTNPSTQLDVNGTINATAMTINGVPVSAGSGDNLGDHTATQNLNLGSYLLVGNGGSSGLAISSGGNVGIGTNAPSTVLDVQQNKNDDMVINYTNLYAGKATYLNMHSPSDYVAMTFDGASQAWSLGQNGGTSFQVGDITNSKVPFTIESGASTNSMYINSSGKVGVGTTNPVNTLQVGTPNFSGSGYALQANGTNYGADIQVNTTNGIGLHVGNAANATTGYAFDIENNKSGTPSMLFNIGWDGKVGIGTTSPSAQLDVNGTINATAMTINGVPVGTGSGDNLGDHTATQNLNLGSHLLVGNGGSSGLAISSGGNVGIGTTSPVDLVSLGSVNASATHASLNLSNTALSGASASGTYIGANPASASADFINYQVGGATKFKVDKNGKVTGDGSGLTGIAAVPAGSNTQVQFNNSGAMGANANLVWDNTNEFLGIGTTSPNYDLHVVGSANSTSAFFQAPSGWNQIKVTSSSVAFQGGVNSSGVAYVGSESNHPFTLNTNNTERMRVTSSGDVGIGTTAPARLLHVNGPMRITPAALPSSPAAGDLAFDSTASNALKFYNGSAWQTIGTGTGNGDFLKNGTVAMTGNFRLGSQWLSNDGDNEGLRIDNSGNVGIGTTTPSQALDVAGAVRTSSGYGATSSSASGLVLGAGGTSPSAASIAWGDNSGWKLNLGTKVSGTFTPRMTLVDSGNVGIDNTSPGNKLTVGSTNGQSNASISARAGNANSFEWGHSNTAGYGSTIGYTSSTGKPFIAFNGEAGTTANTYMSRGKQSSIIQADLAGGFQFGTVASASADNQTFTPNVTFLGNGNVGIGTTTATIPLTVAGRIASGAAGTGGLWVDGGSNQFFGSYSSTGMGLYNSGWGLVLDNSGKVGIGTGTPNSTLDVRGNISGGFGAAATSGTLDWNDSSNTRSGSSPTLLLGTASNGPGPSHYFHPFNFEYGSKDGSGQVTQIAIPYADTTSIADGIYIRGRYSSTWSPWRKIISENGSGNVVVSGYLQSSTAMYSPAYYYTSDRRLKQGIREIASPLDKVLALRGVEFDWRENKQHDIGFIAQEVEKVLPDMVKERPDEKLGTVKTVKYGNIVAVTVEAIKELWNKWMNHEDRIQALEKENLELKARLERLEKRLDERK